MWAGRSTVMASVGFALRGEADMAEWRPVLTEAGGGGGGARRAGQIVESTWVVVWGLRGTREAAGIHLGYRWRANFDVARHKWCDLA